MTTNAKHTPGPWDSGQFIGISGAHLAGLNIAFVCSPSDERRAECQANARLIAAAPELLEALKGLLLAYNDPGNEGHTHDEKVKAAVAAIAKATGAQP